jgi:hypothetical protein
MTKPATIVDWVEARPGVKLAGLSEPTKTWVDRMWHALIRGDLAAGPDVIDPIQEAFIGYLGRIDQTEGDIANTIFLFLCDFVSEHCEEFPKCPNCGAIICPHCIRHANGEELLPS